MAIRLSSSVTYSTFGHSWSDFNYCSKLIQNINNEEYDCIINSASAFIPIISPFLNSNIVSISHFVNGKLAINAAYNYKYLSGIVALSNYGKNFIVKKFGQRDGEKVKVIYNFVANEHFDFRNKIHQTPIKIVYPGGTSIMKSVDVIQRLIYRLHKSKLSFEFVWIGGTKLPGNVLSFCGLKTLESLLPKDNRVVLKGNVSREEAIEIISSANIFLLPSRGEGCPMTLLEAMRAGCISIVSDAQHGSKEIIENSKSGVIVRQDSSAQLFSSIEDIVNNYESYFSFYCKSQTFLSTNLSQEIWSESMNTLITEAAENSKKRIDLNINNFKKSLSGFLWLNRKEVIKNYWHVIKVRFNFNMAYMANILGLYR